MLCQDQDLETKTSHESKTFRCSCREGRELKADGKTCNYDGYVYVGGGQHGFTIGKNFSHLTNNVPISELNVHEKNKVLAMAHDLESSTIFYAYYNYTASVSFVIAYRAQYRYQYVRCKFALLIYSP